MGLLNFLSLNVGLLAGSQIGLRTALYKTRFPMPHQHARFLDHPLRMKYRHPQNTLGPFGFTAGMTVLDLGCGTGTFTLEMARMVGPQGKVHAVDLQEPLLEQAKERVKAAGESRQVQFHCSGAEKLPLADNSVELAVLIATLSEIPDRATALHELRRVLKPTGRIAVSEEILDPAYVPPSVTCRWLEEAGFHYGGKTSSLLCYSCIYTNPT